MKDFKYCIWFCPDMNHYWNHFTNRFPSHLSLKTNLDYNSALELYSKIQKEEIEVELNNLMCDEEDNFHALFYTLKDFLNTFKDNQLHERGRGPKCRRNFLDCHIFIKQARLYFRYGGSKWVLITLFEVSKSNSHVFYHFQILTF